MRRKQQIATNFFHAARFRKKLKNFAEFCSQETIFSVLRYNYKTILLLSNLTIILTVKQYYFENLDIDFRGPIQTNIRSVWNRYIILSRLRNSMFSWQFSHNHRTGNIILTVDNCWNRINDTFIINISLSKQFFITCWYIMNAEVELMSWNKRNERLAQLSIIFVHPY